jgi:hypothetical protein
VVRHLPYLAAVALAALLAGLPLFQFRIMDGHDALEYLPRAVEFYEGLRSGQILPRWAPDLSGGFGQPFFSFNPPIFYYAASAFRALGASFVAAQNLAIFALLLLAGLGMYLLAGAVYGRRGGLVSAVAYLLAPYLLTVLYVRHALADFSAFAFIPLALWGIYRFATAAPDPVEHAPPSRRRPSRSAIYLVVASCATGLLMLSSNPVSLVGVPALAAFAGWLALAGCVRGQGRFWPVLGRSLAGPLLGLGLSAFFWMPALLERDWIQVSRLLDGYLHYANHFVYPFQYLLSPWGYGLSLPGPVDGMSFALGPAHLLLGAGALALLPGLWRRPGWSGVLLAFFLFLSVSAAFMASTASAALWARLPLLQYLEFPWRFLSLVAVATAFLCGAPLLFLERRGNRLLAGGLMVLLIAGLMVLGLPRARPERFLEATDADHTPGRIAAWNVPVTTAREYEPVWVQERPTWSAGERLSFVEGQGLATAHAVAPVAYNYHVEVVDTARLRVNTFYFPGWTVYVDGQERSVVYDNRHGVMEFKLEAGDHWVQVRFEDTALRRWSTVLSLLAAGLLLVGALRATSRHPRKGPGH